MVSLVMNNDFKVASRTRNFPLLHQNETFTAKAHGDLTRTDRLSAAKVKDGRHPIGDSSYYSSAFFLIMVLIGKLSDVRPWWLIVSATLSNEPRQLPPNRPSVTIGIARRRKTRRSEVQNFCHNHRYSQPSRREGEGEGEDTTTPRLDEAI